MSVEQVAAMGPAFAEYLRCFRPCFVTHNTFAHLGTYGIGQRSGLARSANRNGNVRTISHSGACAWP